MCVSASLGSKEVWRVSWAQHESSDDTVVHQKNTAAFSCSVLLKKKINQPNKAVYQLCCENTGSLLGSRVEILTIPIPGSQVLESLGVNWPTGLKLKRSGSSRPLGRRVLGWRSSSKKACAHASRGDSLVTGVYSSSREQRAIASGGVRGLNTWREWDILANTLANHSDWD